MKFKVRKHQKEAIDRASKHFSKNSKGLLTMACGAGKTFTSLKIKENLKSTITLVCCPTKSLALQFSNVWDNQSSNKILKYHNFNKNKKCLKEFISKKGNKVIFSTYQSIKKIIENLGEDFIFDFIVCDESHRTATKKDGKLFKLAHDIKFKKKLSMTATKKIYLNCNPLSMDNEEIYGKEFYSLGFSTAIENKLLSKVNLSLISLNEMEEDLSKTFKVNAHAAALNKIISDNKSNKIMVFSTKTKDALELKEFVEKNYKIKSFYVDGKMKIEDREKEHIDNIGREDLALSV